MKIYLDTSSLFKLYKRETGSEDVDDALSDNNLTGVFLSEITTLEFFSAVFKRVRMKDLNPIEAKQIIELFENDADKYLFVPLNKSILDDSKLLISKHGAEGLRTLDAIQLASAVKVKNLTSKFFASDKLLQALFEKEGLPIG